MASRRIAVVRGAGLVAALLLVAPARRAGAQVAGGTGAVNDKAGNGVTVTAAGAAKPGAKGLSLAGDKVFSKVKESYSISDNLGTERSPNAKAPSVEKTNMQAMTTSVQGLLKANNNAAATKTFVADALANFKPAGKDFAPINKGTQILVTDTVSDENKNGADREAASALARQNAATRPGTLTTAGTFATAATMAGKAIPNPMAVAYAVNVDPTAVTWNSLSNRSVTVDLSDVTLTATTTGMGSLAAAAFGLRGDFVNGTDDVTTDQSSASSLFSLSLGLLSADGGVPSVTTDLSFLGFTSMTDPGGLAISDSLGGSGLAQVLADMTSDFAPAGGGTFGFGAGFTITMDVPGDTADTLLYLDEADGAASAVPDPSSLALSALGAVPLAGYARRRKARA